MASYAIFFWEIDVKAEHYFLELSKSIKELASKADLIMFEGPIQKKDHLEIFEDALILHIFHMSVFGVASPILARFLEKSDVKEKLSAAERKSLGAFFTPPYIAEYIVKETIEKLTAKKVKNKSGKKAIEALGELKICDPSMGGGIFLVCAQDYVMQKMIEIDQDYYSVEELAHFSMKTVFGVDINPKAVEFSRLMLNLNTAKWKLLKKFDEFALIAQ